jgi:hypothetical protein
MKRARKHKLEISFLTKGLPRKTRKNRIFKIAT